ncbi:MAG: VOC family protein [Gammaproteobacteria bacterium]|nr:VOC family protein [Gammaproteobacteria bacterium]
MAGAAVTDGTIRRSVKSGSQTRMDIRRITEVGVAVRDLEQATQLFVDLFNAEAGDIVDVERYSMRFRMCRVGKIDFELMEPTGDTGVIAEFLAKRGEGLHHIAFAIDDIENTMDSLGKKGVRFVDDAPIRKQLDVVDYAGRTFSDDIQFTFSHPASILGILFEFIQYPDGYQTP